MPDGPELADRPPVFCDQCGQAVSPEASVCPRCGSTMADGAPVPGQRTPTAPASFTPPRVFPGAAAATAGRVARGPGVRAWLGAIVMRNVRGTAVGIFAAWFNVPFVVLMAGLGAVVGGLAGVVTGTFVGPGVTSRIDAFLIWVFPIPVRAADLLPTAAAQIGGIVGGILGAINGGYELAWRAFVWPWQELYQLDPTWPAAVAVGQVVTALFVGGLFVAWTSTTESLRLRVSGARPMSRREADWLMPIAHECAARMGLRSLPRILIDDRREANAHAGVRYVVLNYGLLEQLDYDREAIGAVLAHELAHWRDGDAIGMAWAKGVALPLYLLYEFAERLLSLARSRPMHFIVRFLFWSVIVTTRYFVIPIQAGLWRRGEYRADAAAAAAGYTEGMRRALTHLRHSFDGERSGWDRAICATHPPNELRLERLEQPGRGYPLREDHPLLKAMPGHTIGSTVEKGW